MTIVGRGFGREKKVEVEEGITVKSLPGIPAPQTTIQASPVTLNGQGLSLQPYSGIAVSDYGPGNALTQFSGNGVTRYS